MVIQHRSRAGRDVYRLKGSLDEGACRQLAFIVGRLGTGGRILELDFGQVSRDADAPLRLKELHAEARPDCEVRFAGVAARERRSCARLGLPPGVFV